MHPVPLDSSLGARLVPGRSRRRSAAALRRVGAALPTGRSLPHGELRRRHHLLLGLLWAHAVVLPVYAVARGKSPLHAAIIGLVLAAVGALATPLGRPRRAAALLAVGLVTASAMVVHLSGGVTASHLHPFVMVILLGLYEDWAVFAVAAAYVLVRHGLVDAGFIVAACAASLLAWRMNEDLREQAGAALRRAQDAEAAARRAAADLERSNRDLEQFAYVASHDLSEPLRTVASFLELLDRRHGAALDPEAQEFVVHARDGARRMQQLIEALLRYSRIGRAEPATEPVDLSRVAQTAVQHLAREVAAAHGDVEVGALPVVRGDAKQLGQLVEQLVANALKFRNGEAPRVRISAERDGDAWTVAVHDNGIGVDPGQEQRIFEMFRRLHGREAYDGPGMGLAICERIVERHGGRIWVEPAPGGGSVFRFTLPA